MTPRLNSCSDIYLNFTSIFSSFFSNAHRSLVLPRHERSQHPSPFWNRKCDVPFERPRSCAYRAHDSCQIPPFGKNRFGKSAVIDFHVFDSPCVCFARLMPLDTRRVNPKVPSSRRIFRSAGIVRSVDASESLRRVKGDGKRDWEIETASIILWPPAQRSRETTSSHIALRPRRRSSAPSTKVNVVSPCRQSARGQCKQILPRPYLTFPDAGGDARALSPVHEDAWRGVRETTKGIFPAATFPDIKARYTTSYITTRNLHVYVIPSVIY